MPQAGAAIFTLSAMKAVSDIGAGYMQHATADYNAVLVEGQAKVIEAQKRLEQGRYIRGASVMLNESMAKVAKNNVMPTGSPIAAMVEAQTQIRIDQAIAKYNRDAEKRYLQGQADLIRGQGNAARFSGFSNAFSDILTGVSAYAMTSKGFNTKGINTNAGATNAGRA